MLKNYFKIAFRNLAGNKLFSGLNILGLATGMTCSMFIFLWVKNELSFDKFHANADKIYRVTAELSDDVKAAVVPPPLATAIKTEIPAIKDATRLIPLKEMITAGTKKFEEKNIYFADTNFLKIFSYPLLEGNALTALSSPDAVVLTEATARRYFNSAQAAVGKTIFIDNDITGTHLRVTGVLKNIPSSSHLQFDLLLSTKLYERMGNAKVWDNYAAYVYFQLAGNFKITPASINAIEKQINAVKNRNDQSDTRSSLSVQALTDIHLRSDFMLDVEGQGSIRHVTIFSLVAIFILLIACINFVNLSTAFSSQRAKEVGLRKTVGAQRGQLIFQFMGEALLLAFTSLALAIALTALLIPFFNELASTSISFNLFSMKMVGALFGMAAIVGLLSGSYPAFVLSSFNLQKILKGSQASPAGKRSFRNGLIVLQFVISVILMISTLVVYQQLQFIKNRDIGFDKNNLLYVKMPEVGDLKDNKDALKAMLDQYPGISEYTITDHLPTYLTAGGRLSWPGADPQKQVIGFRLRTDENFIKTFGMRLAAGRFFSGDFKGDDSSYVVNETATKIMGIAPSEAIGKKITMGGREGEIIGVVNDFNFQPVRQLVEPLVIRNNFSGGYLVMRTSPGNIQHIIEQLKEIFVNIYDDYPFSYGFVNEDLSKLYATERQMGKLFNAFSVLSIIISSLGLFGLTTYTIQKRTKEIGVRKVLGASVSSVITLLSKV
ncbi:ABC-type antimicrobial peptide transport system permease subunit [Anseongella ginsenosidimutans]|uniref:ABC-type antimicrobial peptide transport system permease subunit n=1 Tax=Anseongella ginsenosidimutans TaxID=496056 RepID=A0A4R3KJY1_9SPHI|nr:ABC transporter permease [Anseongella ginsenosidimutans]QEC53595.1 FtsX-like permease family protein [Anseongella ginsenosidimutans]TCS83661.1 ABC-type antimicrobial peptide transport system permease subunit [Anseongella ginsenosidimutans]